MESDDVSRFRSSLAVIRDVLNERRDEFDEADRVEHATALRVFYERSRSLQ